MTFTGTRPKLTADPGLFIFMFLHLYPQSDELFLKFILFRLGFILDLLAEKRSCSWMSHSFTTAAQAAVGSAEVKGHPALQSHALLFLYSLCFSFVRFDPH